VSGGPTPSQTVGPFFSLGLCRSAENDLVGADGGVWLRGRVLDGAGEGVPDAMVEAWAGSRWGRSSTGSAGEYELRLPAPEGAAGERWQVPLLVFARGLLKPVLTRVYHPGGPAADRTDPLLSSLPGELQTSLVAGVDGDDLRFDIRLQGPGQTTFFAW
jgi:protocatechuate 3,4-dioxygenase alpha subunit